MACPLPVLELEIEGPLKYEGWGPEVSWLREVYDRAVG